jgi:hypothetical protein
MTTETVCAAPIRMRLRSPRALAAVMMAVFENEDLLGLILQHAELAPREFVWVSRVNKTWLLAFEMESSRCRPRGERTASQSAPSWVSSLSTATRPIGYRERRLRGGEEG